MITIPSAVPVTEKRYQVFVSSTFADLERERYDALRALVALNCIPAGMEYFPAIDEAQFDYIKRVIDMSDYYLILSAGKYGSTGADGVSYTEREYDYAVSKGIPIIAILQRDLSALPQKRCEQSAGARKRLEKFRKKIYEERLVRFWDEPGEIHSLVTAAMTAQMTRSPAVGWVRHREPLPSLLGEWHYMVLTPNHAEISHWGTCNIHQSERVLQFHGQRDGESVRVKGTKTKQRATERFWKSTWSEIGQDGTVRAFYDVTLEDSIIRAFFSLAVGRDSSTMTGDYFLLPPFREEVLNARNGHVVFSRDDRRGLHLKPVAKPAKRSRGAP